MPSIAIIGASSDRSKFGNKAVRAYRLKGYDVYPVHPKATEIEGLKAYATIEDVPGESLDRVSLYLPPERGLEVLERIARKNVGEVWVNPGAGNSRLMARGRELGLNLIAGCSIVDIGVDPHQLD
jgi:predicted CoA-binding protein